MLVVDDHEVLREGVRRALELCDDVDLVAEAATGATGLQLAHELEPDVILLDYRLPDTNAAEVIAQLRSGDCASKKSSCSPGLTNDAW